MVTAAPLGCLCLQAAAPHCSAVQQLVPAPAAAAPSPSLAVLSSAHSSRA